MVAVPAVRARVVGGGERADDELARLDRPHGAADLLYDAAVFVPHRGGPVDGLEPAIRPEVRPAHAGGRDPDDGVRRSFDPRRLAILEADVARAVEDCPLHGVSPRCWLQRSWQVGQVVSRLLVELVRLARDAGLVENQTTVIPPSTVRAWPIT